MERFLTKEEHEARQRRVKASGWTPIEAYTFPAREQLKKLGCRWDPDNRVWMVPPGKAEAARALVGK